MGWVSSVVQGASQMGASMVTAAAARDAASKEDKAAQRALREARLNEKTRHSEWEAEQAARQRRYDAWQGAMGKFFKERLGFDIGGGSGGGGVLPVSTTGVTPAVPTNTAQQQAAAAAQPGPEATGGMTLGQIAGGAPTNEGRPAAWNDWGGYNLG